MAVCSRSRDVNCRAMAIRSADWDNEGDNYDTNYYDNQPKGPKEREACLRVTSSR